MLKKTLKIAIYSGNIPSTTFIENLIEGLSERGVKVLLFGKQTKKVSYDSPIKVCGLSSHKLIRFFTTLSRSLLLFIRYPKRFFTILNIVNHKPTLYLKWTWWTRYVPVTLHLPDIFHVQWAKDLESWLFLKSDFNVKIVLSLLGSHINYSPKVDTKLAVSYRKDFPQVDAFHGVSQAIIKEAELYNANPKKCTLIYTQLKPSTFQLYHNSQTKEIDKLKVLSIGRHHWVKGYDYAIDAMALLKQKGVDFQYSIIAQGIVPESLLFKVDDCNLRDEVQFLSGIPQEKIFDTMKSYDVLLLPSLNEGIANVVVEAMAIGLLVVSSDCGGMSEIVVPNETGWLTQVRQPESIANTLVKLKETTFQKRMGIAQNAHELVKEKFFAPEKVNDFINLYNSIMDE